MVQSILEILHSLYESIESLLADSTTVTCRLRDLEIVESIIKKLPFLFKGCNTSLKITEVLVLEGLELSTKTISLVLESLHCAINLCLKSFLNSTRLGVRVGHQFALKLIQVNSILLLERSEIASHRTDFDLHQLELLQNGCSIEVTSDRGTSAHIHGLKSLDTALVICQNIVINIQTIVCLVSTSLEGLHAAHQVVNLVTVVEGVKHLFLKRSNTVDSVIGRALASEKIH